MDTRHLAELNIGRIRYPLDDPGEQGLRMGELAVSPAPEIGPVRMMDRSGQ